MVPAYPGCPGKETVKRVCQVSSGKVLVFVRCRTGVSLLSKQLNSAKKKDTADSKKSQSSSTGSSKACGKPGPSAKMSGKPADAHKFELYFDFKAYINAVKPHQVCVF